MLTSLLRLEDERGVQLQVRNVGNLSWPTVARMGVSTGKISSWKSFLRKELCAEVGLRGA